jgi:hypothetical protein
MLKNPEHPWCLRDLHHREELCCVNDWGSPETRPVRLHQEVTSEDDDLEGSKAGSAAGKCGVLVCHHVGACKARTPHKSDPNIHHVSANQHDGYVYLHEHPHGELFKHMMGYMTYEDREELS